MKVSKTRYEQIEALKKRDTYTELGHVELAGNENRCDCCSWLGMKHAVKVENNRTKKIMLVGSTCAKILTSQVQVISEDSMENSVTISITKTPETHN